MLLLMTIALASLRIAASTPQNKIDAVMLTHKDNKVLKHSIDSALKYLVDVGKIYVISKGLYASSLFVPTHTDHISR